MTQQNSDSYRNPLRYQGQDYAYVPLYYRQRDPTTTDIRPKEQTGYYILGSQWVNTANGDLWFLASFTTVAIALQANWELLTSTSFNPILKLTPDSGTSLVTHNDAGNVNITSSNGTIVVNGSAADTINLTLGNVAFRSSAMRVFTTPGSSVYIPTANTLYCIVEVVGAGGGGGGASVVAADAAGGAGGGCGGYAKGILTVAQATGQTITIGGGGAGGSSVGGNGGTGGDTSFGILLIGGGGGGGNGATGAAFGFKDGGTGGGTSGAGVSVGVTGQRGGNSIWIASGGILIAYGGVGAQGIYSTGGLSPGSFTGTDSPGFNGVQGGGGSGAFAGHNAQQAGGNGGNGLCIITEFIAA